MMLPSDSAQGLRAKSFQAPSHNAVIRIYDNAGF